MNCKYKAKIYLGSVDIDMDADGVENDDEKLVLSFDSKAPISSTLRWKDGGIKIGKEVFSGFDTTHGVYMPLDGVDLADQGRFVRIVGEPVKVQKSGKKCTSNKKSKSKKSKVRIDSLQQMDYLDF